MTLYEVKLRPKCIIWCDSDDISYYFFVISLILKEIQGDIFQYRLLNNF
jgi:hypothetical protein